MVHAGLRCTSKRGCSGLLVKAIRHKQRVQTDMTQQLCEKEKISFIETSALDATNVELAFQRVLTEVYYRFGKEMLDADDNTYKPITGVKIVASPDNDSAATNKKSACCSA